jgi:monofunctional biosynthetic peptidoglycan transglycosylase
MNQSVQAMIAIIVAAVQDTVRRCDSANAKKLSRRVIGSVRPLGYHRSVAHFSGRRIFRTVVRWVLVLVAAFYGLCLAELVALRWINPPTTAVQVQRRVEAWLHHQTYRKREVFLPLARISPDLQHAVISAEDGRFYQHHGIDWQEVQKVVDKDMDEGKLGRGGSTITQQLVKNLFLTTNRSLIRKAVEFTLAPAAEWILPKRRILEVYLNVIEWGPGAYGAEAGAQLWYNVPASKLNRDQSAKMAAILPAPLRWKPEHMGSYSAEILRRMAMTGW